MKKLFFIILSFLLIFSIHSKDNNKITYYKPVDSIHWRVIIAFTDTNQISEDWNWFYYDIEEACKKKSIFVSHSLLNNDYVDVGPSDKPIFKINISEYRKKYKNGYIFLEKDKEIKYVEYSMSQDTLSKASEYFKLDLID